MILSDQFFFSVFNHYKTRYKKHANTIAIAYITLLQSSLVLLLGVFFSVFLKQMNTTTMSSTKAWVLFFLTVLVIYFKNWLKYSGKTRKILNAKANKSKSQGFNIFALFLLPFGLIFIALLLLKSF
ncbi:hypothetical protein [Ichthyenterobacterium magnum]|uniref:Uncharacterized protein n=1 Tax=Ichthyenterobacterium magnum TaxID=1230530 RepID=A0A420DWR1_9FLAO|nr:hypothetical protein [Ichthyenterobacterium magnum]RKE98674.1 hypothetical protein BXY80_0767 [Ichthyenterobacterium magnum]